MVALAHSPSPAFFELTWSRLGATPVGGGFAVWVRVDRAAADVEVPDRVEALRIEETGDVPRLRIRNDGPNKVLVAGNLVVKGGWQTRAIERSIVLGPGTEAFVPVRCVEAGRWSGRDRQSAERFVESAELGLSMKRRAVALKKASVQQGHGYTAPQGSMWSSVADELTSHGLHSETSSYEAVIDDVRSRHRESARRARVEAPEGANGVLLLPADGMPWLEVLPTHAALASQLDRILPDLYEAEGRIRDAGPLDPSEILARIWESPMDALETVAGTIGASYAVTGRGLGGELLLVDGALAHLACGEIGDVEHAPMPPRRARRWRDGGAA